MIKIDISYGEYASKWGLTDFYEESEQKLKEELESGEDFDTGWFGCKKEINYAKITRDEDGITVEVCCHMDDLWEQSDLIYDALSSACKVEEELPRDIIESIRDACCDDGIDDYTEISETLPCSATYEEVVELMDKLESEAYKDNEDMYNRLCEIVKEHYEYWKETQNDRL